jgi:hypothetical protein
MEAILNLFALFTLSYSSVCNSLNNTKDYPQKLQDSSYTNKIFITFKGYDSSNLGIAWFYCDEYNQ